MYRGRTTLALAAASLAVVVVAQTTPVLVKDFASNTVADRLYPPQDAGEIAPGVFVYADFSRADPGGIWAWDSASGSAPQLISAHRLPSGLALPLSANVDVSGTNYPFALQSSRTSNHGIAFNGAYWYGAFGGGSQGFELYRSNGTASGSALFKDLWLGTGSSAPHSFVTDAGQMYFAANGFDAVSGKPSAQLYKSDGTSAATQAFASFGPTNGQSTGASLGLVATTNNLVVAGGRIYASIEQSADSRYSEGFIVDLLNLPARPIRSDLGKTTAELIQFEGSDVLLNSRITAGADGNAYFCGHSTADGNNGLFIDSGTSTDRIVLSGGSSCTGVLAADSNGAYFFARIDGNQGLYRARAGSVTSVAVNVDAATTGVSFGPEVFFIATGSQPGLMALDPVGGALRSVASFDPLANPGSAQYGANILTQRNGALWYSVRAPNANPGLYRLASNAAQPALQSTDATQYASLVGVQAQAAPYPRPQTGQRGSSISNTAPQRPTATGRALQPMLNGEVVGAANDSNAGGQRVTFISDSTEAGTRTLEVGSPLLATLAIPGGFMAAYSGNDVVNRLDYVTRDGVTTNVFTNNLSSGNRVDDVEEITALNQTGGRVFFVSNGVVEGNSSVTIDGLWAWSPDLAPYLISTEVSPLTPPMPLGHRMVYICSDQASEVRLCATDGGSEQILQTLMRLEGVKPSPFIRSSGNAQFGPVPAPNYFAQFLGYANDKLILEFQKIGTGFDSSSRQLVATDGTPEGTHVIVFQNQFATPDDYLASNGCRQDCAFLPATPGVSLGGKLIFGFGDSDEGQELWQIDGTSMEASRLVALRSGAAGGSPALFTAAGDVAYFVADNGNGGEIWRTDGTAAGTLQVTDFAPGPMGSDPSQLVWSPDLQVLHFAANRSDVGRELFRLDSNGQVSLESDFNAGPQSGRILNMVRAGRNLVLSANNGTTGEELYAAPVALNGLEQPRVYAMAAADVENTEVGSLAMRVVMDPPAAQAVTVDYATADGTATAGVDYTSSSGTLNFAAGETEKLVMVAITDDQEDEPNETLLLTLSDPVGAAIGNDTAVGVIQNDDRKIQNSFAFTTDSKISTISISAGNIRHFEWRAPPAGSPEADYQHGFLFLEVDKLTPGEQVNVTVSINVSSPDGGPSPGPCPIGFPGQPPPPPTPGCGAPSDSGYTPPENMVKCLPTGCAVYPAALMRSGAEQLIEFSLVDGGSGDADGLANTVIVDPIAPVFPGVIESFEFIQRNNVSPNRVITSERVTVSGGAGACTEISGDNGLQFSINDAAFTNTPSRLCVGQTVSVRHVSSGNLSTSKTSSLLVGDLFTVAFTTVTTAADRAPDAFTFATQSNVAPGAQISSETLTLTGYNVAVQVSPAGSMEYSINGGAFTKAKGTLRPGDRLKVRHTASTAKLGYTKSSIKVGETTGSFTTRTRQ